MLLVIGKNCGLVWGVYNVWQLSKFRYGIFSPGVGKVFRNVLYAKSLTVGEATFEIFWNFLSQ